MAALTLKLLNIEMSWILWAEAAIVPGLVSMAVVPWLLYKLDPPEIKDTPEAQKIAQDELEKDGEIFAG